MSESFQSPSTSATSSFFSLTDRFGLDQCTIAAIALYPHSFTSYVLVALLESFNPSDSSLLTYSSFFPPSDMSFLRRISNAAHAFLPSIPNSNGQPAPFIPRRATETVTRRSSGGGGFAIVQEDFETSSRASWELSDDGSEHSRRSFDSESSASGSRRRSDASYAASASGSSSASEDSDSGSEVEVDSESDDEEEGNDRYDMMTRHLWSVAERQGWFRDAEFDGLVSIR